MAMGVWPGELYAAVVFVTMRCSKVPRPTLGTWLLSYRNNDESSMLQKSQMSAVLLFSMKLECYQLRNYIAPSRLKRNVANKSTAVGNVSR